MMAAADKSSGSLGVLCTIGQEGGSGFAGAGVATFFTRDIPGYPAGQGPPGLAHVIPYAPYEYRWRNLSYLGTAHQRGGFGVRVFSQDYDGGPWRVDQDYSHWSWSDGSSWNDDHHNRGMPGMDHAYALEGTEMAPYFSVEPHRWYAAWIWCFISADAHGGSTFSAAYAQAQIAATVETILIGQQ
jgi:hypothetical protein